MSELMHALYRCEQIRTCEQQAIAQFGIHQLMTRAGTEAFFFLLRIYPQVRHLAVYCGSGNNAGDGYVLARLAHEHGLQVIIYQCKAVDDLPDAAKHAALAAQEAGVPCLWADEHLDAEVELIVDALLGIGISGPVYGLIAAAISQINASALPVFSLDVPSGLNADSGLVANFCVKASTTLTFIALKSGMYTLDGPDYCGVIYCRPLQLEPYLRSMIPVAFLLDKHHGSLPLPSRKKNSHKGNYGHVLVIGGGPGMPGAAALAAKAALRSGAGAVSIATWPAHTAALLPVVPEAMIWGVHTAAELESLLAKATFCIIGPGLGDNDWAKTLFLAAISSQLPMVIDASALRLLAEYPQLDDNWVLTPHPGEAAHLLSCPTAAIQEDRYQAISALQQRYGGVVLLKGVGTVIQTLDKNIFVCPNGNPGMASAGMGDVLSGIIAGLAAQGLSLSAAALLGVWAHAAAADKIVAEQGERGLLASDLLDVLPMILN